jgi:hypothetical protein
MITITHSSDVNKVVMAEFGKDKPDPNPKHIIMSDLLKSHEKLGTYGCIDGKIPINKCDKKQTLIDLKHFMASLGMNSKEARRFFKKTYIIN